jgi:glucokinase
MGALLADIGGTHARFALLAGAAPGPALTLKVAAYPTVEAAMAAALAILAPPLPCRQAVLALAGPVEAEPVRLTNAPWTFSRNAIAARFGLAEVTLVNDFLALAHALPHLAPGDLLPIAAGAPDPAAPMLVLGPGTGLGASLLLPGNPPRAIPTEGGHIGLAPTNALEDAAVAALRADPAVTRAGAEEALSGRGLARLHALLAARMGAAVPVRDAAAVLAAVPACPVAAATEALFLDLLAGTAGDLALATGARGGVFLGGGILPRLAHRLDPARFAARFAAKAPMGSYMAGIRLSLIQRPDPAFLGLAALATLRI